MSSLEAAVSLISDLVAFDTSGNEPTAPLMAYVEDYLVRYGATVRKKVLDGGKHAVLLARVGPDVPGGVVLSGHADVVPASPQDWQSNPFNVCEKNGKLYGRGTCDMKGFIGCVLAGVPDWSQLEKPIYLALTHDEEGSNNGVLNVIDLLKEEKVQPSCVIVGEPTGMKAVGAHKGSLYFEISITGKTAHSSHPEFGINALYPALDIAEFFRKLDEEMKVVRDGRFSPPYCTINIGRLDGGTAFNIVPGSCFLSAQARPLSHEQAYALRARFLSQLDRVRAVYPGTTIMFNESGMIPLEARDDNLAVSLAQKATGETTSSTVAYATEAGFFQQAGYPAVICGPGSIEQAHTADEFLALDQIDACLRFLNNLSASMMRGLV